jgi:hypothetical protein
VPHGVDSALQQQDGCILWAIQVIKPYNLIFGGNYLLPPARVAPNSRIWWILWIWCKFCLLCDFGGGFVIFCGFGSIYVLSSSTILNFFVNPEKNMLFVFFARRSMYKKLYGIATAC